MSAYVVNSGSIDSFLKAFFLHSIFTKRSCYMSLDYLADQSMEIPVCVTAYNGKSLYPLQRTTAIAISVTAYNGKSLCVTAYKGKATAQTPTPDRRRPGKSPIQIPGPPPADPGRPLLRMMENPYMRYCLQWKIPISVTAYKGNPYMRYCVQRKSLYALLRAMEIPICVTVYSGKSPAQTPTPDRCRP